MGFDAVSTGKRETGVLSVHVKANVDQLNLVFVILKLVWGARKLCVKMCIHMLAQCLLIVSGFTVTCHYWKHVGVFCGV